MNINPWFDAQGNIIRKEGEVFGLAMKPDFPPEGMVVEDMQREPILIKSRAHYREELKKRGQTCPGLRD